MAVAPASGVRSAPQQTSQRGGGGVGQATGGEKNQGASATFGGYPGSYSNFQGTGGNDTTTVNGRGQHTSQTHGAGNDTANLRGLGSHGNIDLGSGNDSFSAKNYANAKKPAAEDGLKVDGGTGSDTATLSGKPSDYSIRRNKEGGNSYNFQPKEGNPTAKDADGKSQPYQGLNLNNFENFNFDGTPGKSFTPADLNSLIDLQG